MSTDRFKVYTSDHLVGIGRALAVITVTSKDELEWRIESFVFLPKFHEDSDPEVMTWNAKDVPADIPDELFCLDEKFMFQDGLLRAHARLNEALEKMGPPSVGIGINLREAPNQELMQLLRQKKNAYVDKIKEKTGSGLLKKYLNIISGLSMS